MSQTSKELTNDLEILGEPVANKYASSINEQP